MTRQQSPWECLGLLHPASFAIAKPVPVSEVLDVLPVLAAATPGAFLIDAPRGNTASG